MKRQAADESPVTAATRARVVAPGVSKSEKVAILDAGAQYGKVCGGKRDCARGCGGH